ncbi:hypothetical protein BMS3Abin10_01163 [bacterium BMS3Abin10]|nr:hypothetical protein BMS3Abin10_01163 [bacterium BMS3Abin10]GBE38089.1 hypothetical protein BMS3Bbin08_00691 [bacterium BMS3Bbin08]
MSKGKKIEHFRDLEVYQKAFKAAMEIYEITKSFPEDERYSLTSQIRKASRSVCSNIAEGCLRPGGEKEKIYCCLYE